MNPRQQKNLRLPELLMEKFNSIAITYGKKREWAVFSAAVLLLTETSGSVLDDLVGDVMSADATPEKMMELIGRAERGEWHRETVARRKPLSPSEIAAKTMEDLNEKKRKSANGKKNA